MATKDEILIFDDGEIEIYNPFGTGNCGTVFKVREGYERHWKQAVRNGSEIFLSQCGFTDHLAVLSVRENVWMGKTRALRVPVRQHAVAAAKDSIYVCGGLDESESTLARCVRLLTAFDSKLSDNQWRSINPMQQQRQCHCAVTFDTNIFVFGGHDGHSNTLKSVEMLDTDDHNWMPRASLQVERCSASAARLNEFVYVCGGCNDEGEVLSSVERFNPLNNECQLINPMNVARTGHQTLVHRGQLIVIGGKDDDDQVLDTVEIYDVESDHWTTAPMRTVIAHAQVSAVSVSTPTRMTPSLIDYGCTFM